MSKEAVRIGQIGFIKVEHPNGYKPGKDGNPTTDKFNHTLRKAFGPLVTKQTVISNNISVK
jgi:hypothetical protein